MPINDSIESILLKIFNKFKLQETEAITDK